MDPPGFALLPYLSRIHPARTHRQAQMNFRLGRLVVNAEPSLQLKVLELLSQIRD